jgi:uncharacterized protein (DUF427 family)
MVRAIWNDTVIAESDDTIVIEGNHYFPEFALRDAFFKPSETTSVCGWKGLANYRSIVVDGKENRDAAWYYADPKPAAAEIRGRVAFWKGVQVA